MGIMGVFDCILAYGTFSSFFSGFELFVFVVVRKGLLIPQGTVMPGLCL